MRINTVKMLNIEKAKKPDYEMVKYFFYRFR